jgi:hypothetical protein
MSEIKSIEIKQNKFNLSDDELEKIKEFVNFMEKYSEVKNGEKVYNTETLERVYFYNRKKISSSEVYISSDLKTNIVTVNISYNLNSDKFRGPLRYNTFHLFPELEYNSLQDAVIESIILYRNMKACTVCSLMAHELKDEDKYEDDLGYDKILNKGRCLRCVLKSIKDNSMEELLPNYDEEKNKYNLSESLMEEIDQFVNFMEKNCEGKNNNIRFYPREAFSEYIFHIGDFLRVEDVKIRTNTEINGKLSFVVDFELQKYYKKVIFVKSIEDGPDYKDHTVEEHEENKKDDKNEKYPKSFRLRLCDKYVSFKETLIESFVKLNSAIHCSDCYMLCFDEKQNNKFTIFPWERRILKDNICTDCFLLSLKDARLYIHECSVCREKQTEEQLQSMVCSDKHIVCKNCWSKINNRKCPICRKKQPK